MGESASLGVRAWEEGIGSRSGSSLPNHSVFSVSRAAGVGLCVWEIFAVRNRYAAISLGMSVEEVIADLDRFSKNEIDPVLLDYIQQSGSRIGKVRLVLRRNR